jgi:hypothetical protein
MATGMAGEMRQNVRFPPEFCATRKVGCGTMAGEVNPNVEGLIAPKESAGSEHFGALQSLNRRSPRAQL